MPEEGVWSDSELARIAALLGMGVGVQTVRLNWVWYLPPLIPALEAEVARSM